MLPAVVLLGFLKSLIAFSQGQKKILAEVNQSQSGKKLHQLMVWFFV